MTLLDKLEAASGPDRNLDAMIHHWAKDGVGIGYHQDAPAYTTSIDAALTLLPEDRGCEISVRRNAPNTAVLLYPGSERWLDDDTESEAPTAALALLIAIMKARGE